MPNGYGQLIEECRHCLDEIEGLELLVRHLRALTGWTPPRPFDGPLVLIPVYVPRPAAVVAAPKEIRRCGCGRPLRRRRDGSVSDTCFFCQQGRVEPRRV